MDRQGQALELAEQLLTDVELARMPIDQLVLKASRLARLINDDDAMRWLRFEISGVPGDDVGQAHMSRTGRWIDREKHQGYWTSMGTIQASIEIHKAAIQSLRIESLSGDMLNLALTEQRNSIVRMSSSIQQMSAIVSRVTAFVHDFVVEAYHELIFSDVQAQMFEAARQDVDARLTPLSGAALNKIESINQRFQAGDMEAVSQAMNTARRLIDEIANSVFPPRDTPYVIGDEKLIVNGAKVLNRLNAYIHSKGVSDGRRTRLRRAIGDIYERVSVGVHAEVSISEARFVFLQTYILLGEIISLEK